MSNTSGFFQLILLGVGVIVVFLLISYMPEMGFSKIVWEEVFDLLIPLMGIICFLGFAAYMVSHR